MTAWRISAQSTAGQKIIGVNGQVFSGDSLRQAIDDSKGNDKPIHLIVQKDTTLDMVDIDYHDGERYPTLKRVEGTPDLLDEITKPLSPATVLPTPTHTDHSTAH